MGDLDVTRRRRVFLSYKRHIEPDGQLVSAVYEALKTHYDVFIDQTMLVGVRWAERIEQELKQTDFLIPFLSAASVDSEMVLGEIETAHHLHKVSGHPTILPVRVAFDVPFKYPLSAYLNPINWASWRGIEDTSDLIRNLISAINNGSFEPNSYNKRSVLVYESPESVPSPSASAQPIRLETPEGTMDPESEFYIERISDQIALDAAQRLGVTITIKGPRQMGKSSLLMRIADKALRDNRIVAFLDFQLFDKATLTDANVFFFQFCSWLSDRLELGDKVEEYWDEHLGNTQRCTRFMERYLLKSLGQPLVLAMDEVEGIFDTPFRTDFFSMLRSWHNSRATSPIWKKISLVLVTSTEPYQFIDNLNLSPFNVGEVVELTDFTPGQASDLNRLHGYPLKGAEEETLMRVLNGHPYLMRKALYLLASQRITSDQLFKTAADEHGPFGDHLRYHLFRLHGKQELIDGLWQVLRYGKCSDERIFFRLRGAGLIRREGQSVVPRCQLYADFFKEYLDE